LFTSTKNTRCREDTFVYTRDFGTAAYDPRRLKGVQFFARTPRLCIAATRPVPPTPSQLGIANGQFATISALDPTGGDATLRLGRQRESKLNLKPFPHLEHGYATTSHPGRGATVGRILINFDTRRSRDLVNRQQFYASPSRARHDAQILTDSREALPKAISRTANKAVALDAVDGVKLGPETSTGRIRRAPCGCHAARADPKAGSCPTPISRAADQNVPIGSEPGNMRDWIDACTHLDSRPLCVPFGDAFVCRARADERRLAEQGAHKL